MGHIIGALIIVKLLYADENKERQRIVFILEVPLLD